MQSYFVHRMLLHYFLSQKPIASIFNKRKPNTVNWLHCKVKAIETSDWFEISSVSGRVNFVGNRWRISVPRLLVAFGTSNTIAIGMLDRYGSNIWGFPFFIDTKITTLASLLTFFLTWLNKGYVTGESWTVKNPFYVNRQMQRRRTFYISGQKAQHQKKLIMNG